MTHLEIEYKTLLTKSEFLRLQEEFSSQSLIKQTNYYIDTPDFQLKKNRFSLRIRILEHRAELTLKQPLEIGNIEHNQELSLSDAKELIQHFSLPDGKINEILTQSTCPLSELSCWGSLHTRRLEKKDGIGLFALDENHYNNRIDYELEVEVKDPDEGKIAFDFFLKKHSIKFKYASSKVARTAASIQSAK